LRPLPALSPTSFSLWVVKSEQTLILRELTFKMDVLPALGPRAERPSLRLRLSSMGTPWRSRQARLAKMSRRPFPASPAQGAVYRRGSGPLPPMQRAFRSVITMSFLQMTPIQNFVILKKVSCHAIPACMFVRRIVVRVLLKLWSVSK
jgi:hypothetical protein